MPVVHLVGVCGFCLDEPGVCHHPECPRGPALDPLGAAPAQSAPRPATRPSVLGGPAAAAVAVAPVAAAPSLPARPVPHLATAPSVTMITKGSR